MNSVSLCSLAGRYDNSIPPRFLAPIDFLKFQLRSKYHDISSGGYAAYAAHPVGYNIPLKIITAILKNAPNGHNDLQRAATPDQIIKQNSLNRAGGPFKQ